MCNLGIRCTYDHKEDDIYVDKCKTHKIAMKVGESMVKAYFWLNLKHFWEYFPNLKPKKYKFKTIKMSLGQFLETLLFLNWKF